MQDNPFAVASSDVPVIDVASSTDAVPAGWVNSGVAPWRRYGARLLDVVLLGYPAFFLIGIMAFMVAPLDAERLFSIFDRPAGRLVDLFCTFVVAMLVNALVMGTVGTTPGKVIFGISVRPLNPANGGVSEFLKREFSVWLRGWGCAVPIVCLITLALSYGKLHNNQIMQWDARKFVVSHRPSGPKQTILNVIGVALIIAARLATRYLS